MKTMLGKPRLKLCPTDKLWEDFKKTVNKTQTCHGVIIDFMENRVEEYKNKMPELFKGG